jgi:poly(rC)-binding protein 2/3/4
MFFRLLCPVSHIGAVIGKQGVNVKEVRDQTHAKIRIEDLIPGADERVITIAPGSADKDGGEPGDSELALHQLLAIIWEATEAAGGDGQVTARLLISDVGCLLGKQGSVITQIRSDSGANILVISSSKGRPGQMPPCAFPSESVVQVQGAQPEARKAMQLIIAKLKENAARLEAKGVKLGPANGAAPLGMMDPLTQQMGGMMLPQMMLGMGMGMGGMRGMSGEEIEFRLVISSSQAGQLIGKGGAEISKLRKAFPGTKITIRDAVDGCDERIVSVSSIDAGQCMAQIAVVSINQILNSNLEQGTEPSIKFVIEKGSVGALLGKEGKVISEIRQQSRSNVRLAKAGDAPACVPTGDQVLTVSAARLPQTQAAVQLITQRLRVSAAQGPPTGRPRK